MIKKSLLMGLAASAMLFTACSSSDEVTEQALSTVNEIQIQLNTSGRGLVSRAERPLYTIADADNVEYITMVLYKYDSENDKWSIQEGCFDEPQIKWDRTNTTNTIKIKNLDASTQYKVVAYGYNDSSCPFALSEDGSTLVAKAVKDGNGKAPEELFAGCSKNFLTDAEACINEVINVEMRRMVAGLLAYFYNIPVYKIMPGTTDLHAVRYVNVYAGAKSQGFVMPSKEFATPIADNNKEFYFNGYQTEAGKTQVLSFDLKELVADYDTQVEEANNNFSALFKLPAFQEGKVSTVPNSIIKGCYLVPFASHVNANTLVVELADADNNVLKVWYAKNGDDFAFDIQRNSFYGLGRKVYDEATPLFPDDPNNPGNPGDEEDPNGDKPLDLSSDELTVSLHDGWDKIYYMTLD